MSSKNIRNFICGWAPVAAVSAPQDNPEGILGKERAGTPPLSGDFPVDFPVGGYYNGLIYQSAGSIFWGGPEYGTARLF